MPVEASSIFTALSNFGAFGILVAFLMWRDLRAEKEKMLLEQSRLAVERVLEERRMTYDKERLEADKSLSASLAALTSAIMAIKA